MFTRPTDTIACADLPLFLHMQIWQNVTNCLDGNEVSGLHCLTDFPFLMHLTLNPTLTLPQGRGFEHLNSNPAVLTNKVIKVCFHFQCNPRWCGYESNSTEQEKNYDHFWNKVGPSDTGLAWHLLLTPPRSLKCSSGKWLFFLWI